MTDHKEYFEYLCQRSRLGWLYRKYWVYPRLSRALHGQVLDVGCGVGDLLVCRPNTTGVDINPHAVAWCRSQGLDAYEMKVDILPFEAEVFQGVTLDNVIEHIYDPEALLNEIYRVLEPAGVFVVGVPGLRGYASDPDHKVFYDEAKLVKVLEAAGFAFCHMIKLPLPGMGRWLRQYCLYGVFEKTEVKS
jgi:SAM-dependent methyltransferase